MNLNRSLPPFGAFLSLSLISLFCVVSAPAFALFNDHAIFIESCSGKKTDYDINLARACKEHPGKTLVRCKEECTERKGLKCVSHKWVEVEVIANASMCTSDGASHKTKDCSSSERKAAEKAYDGAHAKIPKLLTDVTAVRKVLENKKSEEAKHWEKVEKCLTKLQDRYGQNFKFFCPRDGEGVRGWYCGLTKNPKYAKMAYVLPGGPNQIVLCDDYFGTSFTDDNRAGSFLHETTHEFCGTSDAEYYQQQSDIRNTQKWWDIADVYDIWYRFGACVPEKSTCTPVATWLSKNK